LRLIFHGIDELGNNYNWDIEKNILELEFGDIPLAFNVIAKLPMTEEYQKTEWLLFSVEIIDNIIYITAINKDIWDEHVS